MGTPARRCPAVREFPSLYVDDFRPSSPLPQLCLLTHAHSDHLMGLERQTYRGPLVYCTYATRAIVLGLRSDGGQGKLKFQHLRKESGGVDVLRPLALDTPYKFTCDNEALQVTLLNANHCPGSCMFLIQSVSKAVLFTGDVRCERWHVDALRHHPALLNFTLGNRTALSLYIDNTFEEHADPFKSYKGNFDGIRSLCQLASRYPVHTHFAAVRLTLGYEEVLVALSSQLSTKIHMDPYWYHVYSSAAPWSPIAKLLIENCTMNDDSARLHWCCKNGRCKARSDNTTVYFTSFVTIRNDALIANNESLKISDFLPVPQGPLNNGSSIVPVFTDPQTMGRYLLADDRETLLPGHVLFYFSRHASYPELCDFIELFDVRNIYSIRGQRIESMQRFCKLSDEAARSISSGIQKRKRATALISSMKALPTHKKQLQAPKPNHRKPSLSSSEKDHSEALLFLNKQCNNSSILREKLRALPDCDTQEDLEHSSSTLSDVQAQSSLPSPPPERAPTLEQKLRKNPELWFDLTFDFKCNES